MPIKLDSWTRHALAASAGLGLAAMCAPGLAGEIAGIRPSLPAYLERDLDMTFVNDFLGRGGRSDDFRTQQSIVSARVAERWVINVDHSILTLIEETSTGRIDQMSASLGYQISVKKSSQQSRNLVVGAGLRGLGKFAGENIQNGFHRLVGSSIERLPYSDTRTTDATLWFDIEDYRRLREATGSGFWGQWQAGYQVRAASLLSTSGEWDSTLGLQAILSKPNIDIWLGARSDWRNGYDDRIMRISTQAEEDIAIVLGARFGPLVLETVQQLENKASFGQIRLVSSAAGLDDFKLPAIGLELSTLLPDVHLRAAGRYASSFLTGGSSSWGESVVLGLSYGEPQYRNNTSLFYKNLQVDAGLEFEKPLLAGSRWLTVYGGLGAGWREEKLIGAGILDGEASAGVGRIVLTTSTGLRFNVYSGDERWKLRAQFGVLGRLPVADAQAEIAGAALPIQSEALSLNLGALLEFD